MLLCLFNFLQFARLSYSLMTYDFQSVYTYKATQEVKCPQAHMFNRFYFHPTVPAQPHWDQCLENVCSSLSSLQQVAELSVQLNVTGRSLREFLNRGESKSCPYLKERRCLHLMSWSVALAWRMGTISCLDCWKCVIVTDLSVSSTIYHCSIVASFNQQAHHPAASHLSLHWWDNLESNLYWYANEKAQTNEDECLCCSHIACLVEQTCGISWMGQFWWV